MIQSIEDKSKRELIEVVKIQIAEFQKLDSRLAESEARIEEVLKQNRNFLYELDIKTEQAKEYQRLLIEMDEKSR
jgi:hypothetical protein